MTESSAPTVDLLCMGAAMIDLIGTTSTAQLHAAETFRRSLGGSPCNVAATAVRLGRRAAVMARVGHDAFGGFISDELRRLGIRDEWLQVDPQQPTTLAFYARDAGRQDVLVIRGADQQLALDKRARLAITSSAALHTTTFALSREPCRSALIEAITAAHDAGRLVSLDPNFRAMNWLEDSTLLSVLRRVLPMTTVIKPSLEDAQTLWGPSLAPGEYIEQFHSIGARQVLLTLGRDGVVVSDGQSVERIAAIPVENGGVTGVGDAFTAAAIIALTEGHSLILAARLGMQVARLRLQIPDLAAPLPAWRLLVEQARGLDDALPLEGVPSRPRRAQ